MTDEFKKGICTCPMGITCVTAYMKCNISSYGIIEIKHSENLRSYNNFLFHFYILTLDFLVDMKNLWIKLNTVVDNIHMEGVSDFR